jgi:hypothetical protein
MSWAAVTAIALAALSIHVSPNDRFPVGACFNVLTYGNHQHSAHAVEPSQATTSVKR